MVSCRSASPAHGDISGLFQDSYPCAARHCGLIGIFPIGKPSPQTLRWSCDDFPRMQACLFTSMVYVKMRANRMSHCDYPQPARISPRPDWPLRPPFHRRVFFGGTCTARIKRSARRHNVAAQPTTTPDTHAATRASNGFHASRSPCRDLGIFPIFQF